MLKSKQVIFGHPWQKKKKKKVGPCLELLINACGAVKFALVLGLGEPPKHPTALTRSPIAIIACTMQRPVEFWSLQKAKLSCNSTCFASFLLIN